MRVLTAVHGDKAPDSKPALLNELMKLMRNGWPFWPLRVASTLPMGSAVVPFPRYTDVPTIDTTPAAVEAVADVV